MSIPTRSSAQQHLRPPVAITGDLAELQEFLLENRDRLAEAGRYLENLDGESIGSLLRAYHTVKSDASFVQLRDLRELAHEVEGLLDFVTRGELKLTKEVSALLFDAHELYGVLLDGLEHALTVDGLLHPVVALPGLVNRLRQTVATGLTQDEPVRPTTTSPKGPTTVRVEKGQLDRLAEISQALTKEGPTLLPRVNELTTELEALIIDLQMMPAEGLFKQVRRITRDTSQALNKQVDVITEGGETLISRFLAGKLGEWLPHLIRNAIDHGVESPQDRVAAGKEPLGTLTLRFQKGAGFLVVELSDDGRGIKLENEELAVIFQPGFTTKKELTHISGRGVGLDAVRCGVEEEDGTVEAETTLGQGTKFTLRFPL